jgi:hypothetical protein
MRGRTALVVIAAVLAAGCGAAPEAATTTDAAAAADEAALDFAVSARRAVTGTRFEALSDREVADLILEVCEDLGDSADPDGDVMAFVGRLEAPNGPEVDDQIMGVVLAEGALAACPEVVDAASLRAWEASSPEDKFLAAVQAIAPEMDVDPAAADLVAAGRTVCEVLDGGGTPGEAVVAEFALLFGTTGVTVEEIAAGEAGEREGLLAGGVLGGAASFLCPEHREAVVAYLEGLAEGSG